MKWVVIIINSALAVAVGYFFYFFLISDYYALRHVRVEGMQYVAPSEFLDAVERHRSQYTFLGIPTHNTLLYSKKRLRSFLDEQYLFADIVLDKQLPDTLVIRVVERNVKFRLLAPSHEYLLDDEGVVVKKVTSYKQRPALLSVMESQEASISSDADLFLRAEGDQFARLVFDQDVALRIGQTVVQPETIALLERIAEVEGKYVVEMVRLPQAYPQYLTLRMQGGWHAIMNAHEPIEMQLQRLQLVIDKEIGEERLPRIDYIDLRLGNNVYYRYR